MAQALSAGKYDGKVSGAIVALNSGLKVYGSHLEMFNKDKLDHFQVCCVLYELH